jgi:hypothetical protein
MAVKKTVLGQLASAGEEAIGKLSQIPGANKALEGFVQVKDRVEKLVHGLETMEKRMKAVEKRLDALEKPKRRPATTAKKTTAVKKP